jgi:ribosomal-protein-alanine acetyltransferase
VLAGVVVTGVQIRPASEADLPAIARIQNLSPEGVQWQPASYLAHKCLVACDPSAVLGFLAFRHIFDRDYEILNLAIAPEYRRRGLANLLVNQCISSHPGTWFLEVRESNLAARRLYKRLGFEEVGRRPGYYQDNSEAAVVMRFQSC